MFDFFLKILNVNLEILNSKLNGMIKNTTGNSKNEKESNGISLDWELRSGRT